MSPSHPPLTAGLIAPGPLLVRAVRDIVTREGSVRAAQLLGVSQGALTHLRGSLPVRRGTLLLAAKSISELAPVVRP
jgi:hypothetical protein